jgi:hypothetical protein
MTDIKQQNEKGYTEKDILFSISDMSAAEHAKLSTLIEQDGDADLRQHLLGALGRSEQPRGALEYVYEIPSRWCEVHVLDRLEKAYEVQAMMPAATRPKAYGTAWPSYMPITEGELIGIKNEIFRDGGAQALSDWESQQNRVRLQPSSAQITRMEQALRWPFEYLRDQPEIARAISLRSMWAAMHVNIRRRCSQRRLDHDLFNRQWQDGLRIITQQLIRHRVAVS